MLTADIYAHVLPAVQLIIQDLNNPALPPARDDAPSLEERVHTRLWAYVTHAVRELSPSSAPVAEPPKQDGRSKAWQLIVRFYSVAGDGAAAAGTSGMELVAETDPERVQGTGKLPELVERYATEMHPDDALFPSALTQPAIKDKILQLRNNLGRQGRAELRIEYAYDGVSYLCQVEVTKPGT